MAKIASLLICAVLITGVAGLSRSALPEQTHRQWLEERYEEACSVKEGMTRADLLKLFSVDGGLQRHPVASRYYLKSCHLIKVEVEFDVPEKSDSIVVPEDLRHEAGDLNSTDGKSYEFVRNETLKIKSISKPYLERPALD